MFYSATNPIRPLKAVYNMSFSFSRCSSATTCSRVRLPNEMFIFSLVQLMRLGDGRLRFDRIGLAPHVRPFAVNATPCALSLTLRLLRKQGNPEVGHLTHETALATGLDFTPRPKRTAWPCQFGSYPYLTKEQSSPAGFPAREGSTIARRPKKSARLQTPLAGADPNRSWKVSLSPLP